MPYKLLLMEETLSAFIGHILRFLRLVLMVNVLNISHTCCVITAQHLQWLIYIYIHKQYPPYIQIGYYSQMIYPSLRQYEGGGSGRRDVSEVRPTS